MGCLDQEACDNAAVDAALLFPPSALRLFTVDIIDDCFVPSPASEPISLKTNKDPGHGRFREGHGFHA